MAILYLTSPVDADHTKRKFQSGLPLTRQTSKIPLWAAALEAEKALDARAVRISLLRSLTVPFYVLVIPGPVTIMMHSEALPPTPHRSFPSSSKDERRSRSPRSRRIVASDETEL